MGGRFNLYSGKFSLNFEAIIKDADVIANEGVIQSNKLYDGTALQVDFGYSKKGIGFDANLRRVENMQLLAQRNLDNYPTVRKIFRDDLSTDKTLTLISCS